MVRYKNGWIPEYVVLKGRCPVTNPNTDAAVNFLSQFFDGEIIVVTSIIPDGRTYTKSFGADDKKELIHFIDSLQGKRNIYFQVNPVKEQVSKKTSKDDIKTLSWLHVDIDPRDGYPIEDERVRILEKLQNSPLKPTVIIDSGGGYQAFWKLKEPVLVEGNIFELENHNKTLEGFFAADACHNIDRIMRVPGTINLPTNKKQGKGRTETLAKLINFGEEVYELSDFSEFKPLPERFYSLLDDDPEVRRRWQGNPDGLTDTSRSGFDMSMTSLLIRRGYSLEDVMLILRHFLHGKASEENDRYVERMFDRVDSDHGEIAPYEFSFHGIIWNKPTKDGFFRTPLTNFTVRIIADIEKDDGAEVTRYFELEASVKGKKRMLLVKTKEFSALHWVVEKLGSEAVLHAGYAVKDRTREAIQLLSDNVDTRKIFGQLGWQKINKKWVYLHCDGGITDGESTPDIDVELEGEKLNCYLFPEVPTGEELSNAIKVALSLVDLAPQKVIFSLLAATFRAPLGAASPIDFSLFLVGPTGSQKTELTALTQAFYGSGFHGKNLPGNWNSTSNSLEKAAFITKDCLFTVDDFAPNGTTNDIDRMHKDAGRLLRGQGNKAGRGRMRADGGQRPEYYPRGMIVSSGEDLPKGQSIRARTWVLEIVKGDVILSKLTEAQRASRDGLFSQTMAAYLKWLAPQMDELKKSLSKRRDELRDKIRQSSFAHDRTPDMIASLLIGLEMFLKFALDTGVIAQTEHDVLYSRGYDSILDAGAGQADHQMGEEPATRFVELVSAAFVSGQAHLVDINHGDKPCKEPIHWGWRPVPIKEGDIVYHPKGDQIGWLKEDDIYLEPDAAFRVAQKLARDQGMGLPITQKTLWKRLKEKGFLASYEEDRNLARVTIGGKRKRILHLKASVINNSNDLDEKNPSPANDWPTSLTAS
jgi:hypothetical protein